jgi:hypothetical protein
MNDSLERIAVDLQVLGMLKKGDKLVTSKSTLQVDSGHTLGFISRWRNGESRVETVKYLTNMMKSLKEQAERLCDEKSPEAQNLIQEIIANIERATVGIEELAKTYQDTPDIVANLRVCVIFFLAPVFLKMSQAIGVNKTLKFQGQRWPGGKQESPEAAPMPELTLPPPHRSYLEAAS